MSSRRDVLRFALGSAVALGVRPATAAAPAVAVVGARVFVDGKTAIDEATLVVRDGLVVGAGKGLAVPAGATVIDGKGKVVTAGFIDPCSSVGLIEVAGVEGTNEGSLGSAVHAAYRASDAFNPASVLVPIARTGGVTHVVATPQGGFVSGTSTFAALDGRTAPTEALAMNVVLGEEAMHAAGGSRGRALEVLRELLDDAASYDKRRDAYDRNQTRAFGASRLDLEALVPVVKGRLPLAAKVHRAADIRAFLRLVDERKLRGIVVGGTEAWLVADELAKAKVPVVINPLHNLPANFDRLAVRDDVATLLAKAGVTIAFSTLNLEEGWDARNLRQVAGVAVAKGLPFAEALAAITEGPAAMFGQTKLGRLAPGFAADFTVWSGDPLEAQTRAQAVFVNGVDAGVRTRQTMLLERYRKP